MTKKEDFFVKFWGVRGSIACPGPATVRYGGNTSCLEVGCGDRRIIFDAGTGLRNLGQVLAATQPLKTNLLLTHTHFDHVCGFPFFIPLFIPGNEIKLWAGHLRPDLGIEQVLIDMMMAPLFPVPPAIFQADVSYQDFDAGDTLSLYDDVTVRTCALNHPNRATGYRVEFDGRALCYVTDTEHVEGERDQAIVELIRGADIVVYDATYTDAEYPKFKGYGHSTWEEGVRLVEAANADRLVIFHHDPNHDDDFMDQLALDAEARRPGTIIAREGETLIP
ncbi:MAG: MBL fold metallo-hydrolase [Alphaproteobacteria bacterium]|nr:MBL fold metallo-hydrolase [Alphaproteobacteria bacterium]